MTDVPAFLELFAGIGGFAFGLERAGFSCVGQIENDPFCQRVLERRWPGVARWGDVRSVRCLQPLDGADDAHPERGASGDLPPVDLLVGGFPCQGASVAGKRLGLADDRTALFWEICRVQEIVQAPWALLENVPGLRSVRLGLVLAALKELWPVVGWRTLDSRYFNVAQRRERVFFVCGPDEARVAAVLFEPEGGGGDSAASGEAGARVAGTLAAGAHPSGFNGRDAEQDQLVIHAPEITHALSAGRDGITGRRFGTGRDGQDDFVVVSGPLGDGNDGIGRRSEDDPNLVVGVLGARSRGRQIGVDEAASGQIVVTHPLKAEGHDGSEDGTGLGVPLVPTLGAYSGRQQIEQPYHVESAMAVRRLTPTECARLQAFPDGWCCLCQPLEVWAVDPEAAAERCTCADSPQYRAYGNAVTTTVVEWIGRRLMEVM